MLKLGLRAKAQLNYKNVIRDFERKKRKALGNLGAIYRSKVQKEVTRAPIDEASAPGEPMHVHGKRGQGLKQGIRYQVASAGDNVVVAPFAATEYFEKHESGGEYTGFRKTKKGRVQKQRGKYPKRPLFQKIKQDKEFRDRAFRKAFAGFDESDPGGYRDAPNPVADAVPKSGDIVIDALRSVYGP